MAGPKYVNNFEFPSGFGFSSSASDRTTTTVRSHERAKPHFAQGGAVNSRGPGDQYARGGKAASKKTPGLSKRGRPQKLVSPVDAVRGNIRRQREQDLGLAKGGQAKYAKGGPVYDNKISTGHALQQRSEPTSVLDRESGGKTSLRPGFKKGGMKKAMGGPVRAKRGGPTSDIAQDKRMMKEVMSKHIAAPKPRGHGVKSARMRGGRAC